MVCRDSQQMSKMGNYLRIQGIQEIKLGEVIPWYIFHFHMSE